MDISALTYVALADPIRGESDIRLATLNRIPTRKAFRSEIPLAVAICHVGSANFEDKLMFQYYPR
jgi:hypothetical protein